MVPGALSKIIHKILKNSNLKYKKRTIYPQKYPNNRIGSVVLFLFLLSKHLQIAVLGTKSITGFCSYPYNIASMCRTGNMSVIGSIGETWKP